MLTPQEVAEHGFSKARVGGYSMKEVDDFLDQLTEDYGTLHKENAVLRGKLNSLAKKINEYRETEEAMRSTLLSAQKMAQSMVDEAEEEKQRIISEAETDAVQRKNELEREIAEAEGKLALAQANTQSFIDQMRELVRHESDFLEQLPTLHVTEPAPAEQEAEPESPVSQEEPESGEAPAQEESDPEAEEEPEPEAEAPEQEEAPAASQEDASLEDPDLAPVSETAAEGDVLASVSADSAGVLDVEELAVGHIDFDNLKFGKDYEIK